MPRQVYLLLNTAAAGVSSKRWANLRSDLAAAIETSGLLPILKTADVVLGADWALLFDKVADKRVLNGLSRFARWATLRGIAAPAVDDSTIASFISELETSTLVRNLAEQHRSVAKTWNALVCLVPGEGLRAVQMPESKAAPSRLPWELVPASFRDDVERHLTWTAVAAKNRQGVVPVHVHQNHPSAARLAQHRTPFSLNCNSFIEVRQTLAL